uniref:Uncharacterized protein n=1 Tax=Oncorhynchus tshawytscha TaxID=74940 RepID=A0A8C8GZ05_ONCTS
NSGRNGIYKTIRERMGWFPELFAQCTGGAAVYGKRVTASTTGRQELRKDLLSGILQGFHCTFDQIVCF